MKRSGMNAVAAGLAVAGGAMLWRAARKAAYRLSDRVVVITGGSRGLGLVIARQFAGEGAKVAILARDGDEVARAVQQLESLGAEAFGRPCDVRDRSQVRETIAQVIERFGRIDVLVNNAGTIQVGPIEHMGIEDFQDAMAIHFWAPLYAMWEVIPHMRARGEGRIVNISSIGGLIGVPHLEPYCASKFALTGLSDSIRGELRKDGIYVTTVCPGLMRTGSPMNALFKGRHYEEFTWFAVSDSLPGASISAERAARQIISACRRGDARLIVSIPAKLAVFANTVMPGVVASGMAMMNRLLPGAAPTMGKESYPGRDSHTRWTRSALTGLTQRAAEKNNEVPRPEPATE